MLDDSWDIIVVGGGIAGLTTTALLSKLGFAVLCIEPRKLPKRELEASADLRSTAYLVKSIEIFKEAEVWKNLRKHAEKLKVMRICDAGQTDKNNKESYFDSTEIGLSQFGYNIPNWLTKKVLVSKIKSLEKSQIYYGNKVVKLLNYADRSLVKLSDGKIISTKLIVGADGKNSDIRFLSNIKIKKWDDVQDAIAFVTTHEKEHAGTSIEILQSGGPCTLVPLKNTADGKFQSAVVWVDQRSKAKQLMALNNKEFSVKLSQRSQFVLGNCKVKSRRTIFPIVTQLADKFYGLRVALIAEAAHVMPPIGAQGLNTSFEDISMLTKLLKKAQIRESDIGDQAILYEYGRIRRQMTQSKIFGVTLLNTFSKSNLPFTQNIRRIGLGLIEKNPNLKRFLMKAGLGNGSN